MQMPAKLTLAKVQAVTLYDPYSSHYMAYITERVIS